MLPHLTWGEPPSPDYVVTVPLPPSITSEQCRVVVDALSRHHDLLRLEVHRTEAAKTFHVPDAECVPELGLRHVSVGDGVTAKQALDAATQEGKDEFVKAIRLAQFTYLKVDGRTPDHLLVILDHILYDAYALQILWEDLTSCLTAISSGEPIHLPPKTVSYREWGLRVHEYLKSAEAEADLAFWRSRPWGASQYVPVDFPDAYPSAKSIRFANVTLSEAHTRQLMQNARKHLNASLFEVIYSSVLLALQQTFDLGEATIVPRAFLNDRVGLFDDLNMARTVGNFLNICDIPMELTGTRDPLLMLRSVKEQLPSLPHEEKSFSYLNTLDEPKMRHRSSRLVINHTGLAEAGPTLKRIIRDTDSVFVPESDEPPASLEQNGCMESRPGYVIKRPSQRHVPAPSALH